MSQRASDLGGLFGRPKLKKMDNIFDTWNRNRMGRMDWINPAQEREQ
jgi:hypothetical protein